MAGKFNIIGRIIVLIILILVMAAGGLVWFDYLGVIDAKTALAPVYRLFGREGRTQSPADPDELLSLDAERLAIRLEALALYELELDTQNQDIQTRRGEIEQMAQEVEVRQKAVEDQEKTFNDMRQQAEDKASNVETNARYLASMPPVNAVERINAMEDQEAIDVLRMTEDIARREGTTSLVSVWLQQMPAERAATLQRKMAGSPPGLN
jgi:flagellar protein FlbB